MPRIPPLPESQWTPEQRAIMERRLAGGDATLGRLHIFTTLARHQALFERWLPFGGYLLGRGVLGERERELLILRTGYNCASPYEWGQHVRIGLAVGLDRAEIERVARGPRAPGWSDDDATLLQAADELHRDAKIGADTWARLAARYDERALIEIPMLVGQYHMVAFTLNSLEVEPEAELEGLPG